MATNNNIDSELQTLLSGYYGRDIRMAIHDALAKLWNAASGGDDPGPTPPPTPIPDSNFVHGTLALVFPKTSDAFSGLPTLQFTQDTITRVQYIPIQTENPPTDWDTEYMFYYRRSGIGTFEPVPTQAEPPEYLPNKYFDAIEVAPTDVKYSSSHEYVPSRKNKFRYWLVASDQETTAGYGYTARTAFYDPDTTVYLMRAYASSGYTGPYMLVKSKHISEDGGVIRYYRLVMDETAPANWVSGFENYYTYDSETGIYFGRTSADDPYVRGRYYTAGESVALYSGAYGNGFFRVGGMGDNAYTIEGDAWYGVNTGYWTGGDNRYTSTSPDDWAPLDVDLIDPVCSNWSKAFARNVLSSIGAIPTYILVENATAPADWDDYAGNYYVHNSDDEYEAVTAGTEYAPARYYRMKE